MPAESSPKIGAGEWDLRLPLRHPNVYSIEQTTGPDRLLIGPEAQHIEVLLALAELWKRDYYLLYVLLVPRLGKRDSGRYQSPGPLSFDQVATFCRRFARFLEGDGRHHLWIGSTNNAGLLIYDHHDWIWAYGELPNYIDIVQSRGFREGTVDLPVPHSHGFNAEYDKSEDELMSYCEWAYFPLQPGDEY